MWSPTPLPGWLRVRGSARPRPMPHPRPARRAPLNKPQRDAKVGDQSKEHDSWPSLLRLQMRQLFFDLPASRVVWSGLQNLLKLLTSQRRLLRLFIRPPEVIMNIRVLRHFVLFL